MYSKKQNGYKKTVLKSDEEKSRKKGNSVELKRIEELGFYGNFYDEFLQSSFHNNDLTEQEESDLNYYGSTILSQSQKENSLGEVYKKIFLMGKIAGIKQERARKG